MNLNKKTDNRMLQMDFIKECLTPLYQFQWLKTLPFDPEYMNSIVMYVASRDNRLTTLFYAD